ncbi:MAG TPA: thioredoxin [Cytophagales bacterium]|nr:thioredoxin [Cytophagales bacterium]HAA21154.1 thioredoxin [Cytophagales bacterium]HAP60675.1 thioredoxin [Cytophagales bacterium]
MELQDFGTDVLSKSNATPVLVDFWANWCGPCHTLGPVIEELAKEAQGAWELVKIDTDLHPELSQQYSVRSIPAVKLFHKGEVIAEFTGALPKIHIENWLTEHLPSEEREQLKRLQKQLISTPEVNLLHELETLALNHPDFPEAQLTLASQLVFTDPQRALDLVVGFRLGTKHGIVAEDIREAGKFLLEELVGESPAVPKLEATQMAAKANDLEGLFENLIQAIIADKNYQDELPRKVCIAFFRILTAEHPVSRKYRKQFDMALY